MKLITTLRLFCPATTILLLSACLSVSVQAKKPSDTLPSNETSKIHVVDEIADEIVATVGNGIILLSDIERVSNDVLKLRAKEGTLVNRPARDEALEMLLTQHLLSEQARADSLNKGIGGSIDPQVESQIQHLIKEMGSVKALERKYRKEIFAIKDDIKKDLENQQLANVMQSNVMQGIRITYPEVVAFFKTLPTDSMEMVPEQYVFAQIVRTPPSTDERKFEVRQKLLEYRQRILEGENIGALARLYSMDPGTARSGGELATDINQLVYPIVDILESLKPGNVSEIVESEYGYHIVELISLKENIVHFRQILLKPEFTVEETEREMHLLDSIAKEIGTDKIAFEAAVRLHSMDLETNQNEGLVFNSFDAKMMFDTKYASPKFMKDALQPDDYAALSSIKVGEVSSPYATMDISDGSTIYKIVRLNEIIPTHYANLNEDYEIIADFALQDKQNRAVDKWIDKTIRNMYIWISPEYRDYKLERNWLKK